MQSPSVSRSQVAYARLAGFMFLFVTAVYLVGESAVSSLRVAGDFAATAANIRSSELLYRSGLVAKFVASLGTVALAVGLYAALRPVDRDLAVMALAFRLAEAVLGGVGIRFAFALLQLHVAADPADPGPSAALAAALGAAQSAGFHASILFFSFGSMIFFWLFLRSGYIPRALAIFGLAASALVPAVSLGHLLVPSPPAWLQFGWAPMFLAETGVGLWLLIRGLRPAAQDRTPSLGVPAP